MIFSHKELLYIITLKPFLHYKKSVCHSICTLDIYLWCQKLLEVT